MKTSSCPSQSLLGIKVGFDGSKVSAISSKELFQCILMFSLIIFGCSSILLQSAAMMTNLIPRIYFLTFNEYQN